MSVEAVIAQVMSNAALAQEIIKEAAPEIDGDSPFAGSLATALMTDPARMPSETKERLRHLIGKYIT